MVFGDARDAYSSSHMTRRALWSLSPLLCSLVSLGHAPAAFAQTDDAGAQTVIRRGLIEAAQAASERRDFAQCIESGQRAAAIRDSGSLRKLIAECQMSSHDYVGALGSAELCISILRRDTTALQRAQLLAGCERINVEAQSHTGRLTIVTPTPAPGAMRVLVNNSELPAVAWGIPAIVNAGVPLEVRASAPGFVAFQGAVNVPAGASAEIRVVLVPEPAVTVARATPERAVVAPRVTPNRPDEAPRARVAVRPALSRPYPSPLLATGAVVVTLGVVATSIGFVGAGLNFGDYQSSCATPSTFERFNDCAARMAPTQGSIDAFQAVGYVGVGFAVIGAGFMVYGALRPWPRERATRVAWSVLPLASPGRAGGAVTVRW